MFDHRPPGVTLIPQNDFIKNYLENVVETFDDSVTGTSVEL